MQLGKKAESIDSITKAIDFFENFEERQVTEEEKEGLDSKLIQPSEE